MYNVPQLDNKSQRGQQFKKRDLNQKFRFVTEQNKNIQLRMNANIIFMFPRQMYAEIIH